MTIALCFAGCASTRKARETARTEASVTAADSQMNEVRLIRTEAVPKSEARLVIPADSLLKLPPQAKYTAKSGRANVEVSRDKDVITVYASCDRLQMLVEYYESTSSMWRERYEEVAGLYEEEVKQRSNPVRTFFYGFGVGAATGVLTTLLFIKHKQKRDG